MDTKGYYVLFSMVHGLGPRWLAALTKLFGGVKEAWYAPEKDLRALPKFPGPVLDDFLVKRRRLTPNGEMDRLQRQGIQVIALGEPEYPVALQHIYDPPRIIFLKGSPQVLQKPMVAIVGARRATYYGTSMAEKIARGLAEAGLCVVSGMARGIDSAAHRGALNVDTATAAVLGCGVNVVYPKENDKLMAEIIKKGAVISEFAPETHPAPGNFPQRNRIISGLSQGVLVVEAAARSGSLITADFALEQGRDVFALPGPVTSPLSRGCHGLIKQGARLVEEAADILEELAGMPKKACIDEGSRNLDGKELTGKEKKVYNIISDVPIGCETIVIRTGLKPAEVLASLLVMEIRGLVRQLPGQNYVRVL